MRCGVVSQLILIRRRPAQPGILPLLCRYKLDQSKNNTKRCCVFNDVTQVMNTVRVIGNMADGGWGGLYPTIFNLYKTLSYSFPCR